MPKNEQIETKSDTASNSNDTSNLAPVDFKIAQCLIQRPASTDSELANALGLSRQTINRRRNSDAVQAYLHQALSLPEKEMRRLCVLALQKVEATLQCGDPRLEFGAAVALMKLGEKFITITQPPPPPLDQPVTYITKWADESEMPESTTKSALTHAF